MLWDDGLMPLRTRLGAIALFFAWGFVMHGVGLLLHELGGHALASIFLACGVDGWNLTFFGHGQVSYTACTRWTLPRVLVADWAGLALTITAGLVAARFARSPRLAPFPRLLVALLAFFFLLGQLGYAASGGFHDVYDPGRTARLLSARGLHVLGWLPALVAYAWAASYGARAIVDAFRAQFGARTRRATVLQLVTTLGIGGALYGLAYRIEWQLRTDVAMKGVPAMAEHIAKVRGGPPPFPIEHVLTAIALAAVAHALLRKVQSSAPASDGLTRAVVRFVIVATGATGAILAALVCAH